jgi:hypothetical protein
MGSASPSDCGISETTAAGVGGRWWRCSLLKNTAADQPRDQGINPDGVGSVSKKAIHTFDGSRKRRGLDAVASTREFRLATKVNEAIGAFFQGNPNTTIDEVERWL